MLYPEKEKLEDIKERKERTYKLKRPAADLVQAILMFIKVSFQC